MSEPWWASRPYKDMKMRFEQIEDFRVESHLRFRTYTLRGPMTFFASVAIAGAMIVARRKLRSLSWALYALASGD